MSIMFVFDPALYSEAEYSVHILDNTKLLIISILINVCFSKQTTQLLFRIHDGYDIGTFSTQKPEHYRLV